MYKHVIDSKIVVVDELVEKEVRKGGPEAKHVYWDGLTDKSKTNSRC